MSFQRKSKAEPAEVIRNLREQALHVSAAELNIVPTEVHRDVWGVLVDTGYPEGVATLVALADGTTSLYFSNGGGVIGAGEHEKVRTASGALLAAAEAQLDAFGPVEETTLPPVGRVRFYVKTFGRLLCADAWKQELAQGHHALSPVFFAAHDVIGAVRESSSR